MSHNIAITTRRAVVGDETRPATIVCENGVIADVTGPDESPEGVETRDVGDSVVMPGIVDPHVHVNEPGRTHWEGFETATKAACAGGVTTIVDMPLNSSPVTTSVEALEAKREAADGKLWVDCGLYGGVVPDNSDRLEELLDAGVIGIKAFLCHSGIDEFPNVDKEDLREAMPVIAESGLPLLVHAEIVDDTESHDGDPTDYDAYAATRPQRYERRAIELLVELSQSTGCPVHVVHLAASTALPILRRAREEGLSVSVETCPHYLYFAAEEIPDGDPRYKCAPPIRDGDNREALRSALVDGDIDLVATDHSPSPPELKNLDDGNVRDAWGGIASLELLLPALWSSVRRLGATPTDIARWTSLEPARLLGIDDRVGRIAPGYRANLVVWDPEASQSVDADDLHHRHPVTPYDGERLSGVVEATYLRGEEIYDGEKVCQNPQGRTIGPRDVG